MQYIALAVERNKSHIVKKARLKISEWLDFRRKKSNVIATVYLEFFDSKKSQELDHIYVIIPKNDFERIILPTESEIEEENKILRKKELSRKLDVKSRFILPIPVKNIKEVHEGGKSKEHLLIKINLKEFEVNDTKINRFQFRFYIQGSFRKKSRLSPFSSSWDWIYEAPIQPLSIDKNEFTDITQIKMDLELWVMIEPAMYESVSDLNIRSTRPFDRFIILPDEIAEGLERNFVSPGALCIRWFFPEFSESGLSAEIIVSKKKSTMEREKRYIKKINSDNNNFLSSINQILNDSRIVCVDFNYIIDRLTNPEFQRFLEILFKLMYHRDDKALSKLGELVDILEDLQKLKYGRYYFHMYRLLTQMRACEEVKDIVTSNIKKRLEEFVDEPQFINKAVIDLSRELRGLMDIIEQFYYYNIPEEKYTQRKGILTKIAELRDIADHKLINPESYLIAEEVLNMWERLVEKEFEQFIGSPKLNVKLNTKKLFDSERIYLIFNITNTSDVPLIHLVVRLQLSEQYDIYPQERRWTTKRKRLTKSDEHNERIFSPEFVISPKNFPNVQIQLEVGALTEEGKKFAEIFPMKVELSREYIKFKEIKQNPYIVGEPVKKREMFFGREDTFKKIRGTIDGIQVNQAIIHGQYRVGKTSVLYQLMDELKGKYVPVLAITHGLEMGDSELLRFWSTQIASAAKNRKDKIPEIPDYEKLSSPYQEFQKFLDKILQELGEAKIILMIDEYGMIDDLLQSKKIGEEFFRLLDWMIKHDRIELIMAGRSSMENLKTDRWKKIARPFAEIKLRLLEKEDAKKLIVEPVKEYIRYDDSAIEKIFGLTNYYPYLIQLCCHVLVIYHNLKRKNVLLYADVEDCIPEIIELGKYGLEAMILTDTTPEEQIVLRVMAAVLGEQSSISEHELVVRIRELNEEIDVKDIKKAISRLEDKEVIRSVTEEMRRFKFVCELFRYWIVVNMEPLEKGTPT